jgi:DNA repair exonuclease SbcCD ATPase subunit
MAMIEDTIARLEQQLRKAQTLPPSERRELEKLLAELKAELAAARESGGIPENVPARRDDRKDDDTSPLDKLAESVAEFENTHPQLVAIVNRISTILANMGI